MLGWRGGYRLQPNNKGKEKETPKNVVFVHKIISHQHMINKNEGESGYKIGGVTNAPLTTWGARRQPFIDGIIDTLLPKKWKALVTTLL